MYFAKRLIVDVQPLRAPSLCHGFPVHSRFPCLQRHSSQTVVSDEPLSLPRLRSSDSQNPASGSVGSDDSVCPGWGHAGSLLGKGLSRPYFKKNKKIEKWLILFDFDDLVPALVGVPSGLLTPICGFSFRSSLGRPWGPGLFGVVWMGLLPRSGRHFPPVGSLQEFCSGVVTSRDLDPASLHFFSVPTPFM